jgi:hypothetical protein
MFVVFFMFMNLYKIRKSGERERERERKNNLKFIVPYTFNFI